VSSILESLKRFFGGGSSEHTHAGETPSHASTGLSHEHEHSHGGEPHSHPHSHEPGMEEDHSHEH
jgi:hypothetical protein